MVIYKIPGKLEVTWNDEYKVIIDIWTNYSITIDELREAVFEIGVNYSKTRGSKAWIVDSSNAKGSFTAEIQNLIGKELFPLFEQIGIKYFITITSKVSAVTKMTVSTYSNKLVSQGLSLVEVESVEDALKWIKENT